MSLADQAVAELKNAELCFNRSTLRLSEEHSGVRPAPGVMSAAQQVAHVAQTVDWFIEGAFRPEGFTTDFEAHAKALEDCRSLIAARAWFEKAMAAARVTLSAKSDAELMVPIADGSDMGGSLRNPASFCNVVGFRPSPGRVPAWPNRAPWSPFSVLGPMARTVADAALMLRAIAGPDARSPIAIREPPPVFDQSLERDFRGVRIAWSRDLGGLPVDARVTDAIDARRGVFASLGCDIDDADPDFSGADEAFRSWRAWLFALGYGRLLERERGRIKDTVVWNVEQGLALSGNDLARAEVLRAACYHRVREFMERYEFLVLPVSQVPPFDLNEPWVREIDGTRLENYIDWMRSCYWVTVTGLPAISVPCGFTPEGLPIGVQIVGRHQDDLGVLQFAHAFEAATGQWQRPPEWVTT